MRKRLGLVLPLGALPSLAVAQEGGGGGGGPLTVDGGLVIWTLVVFGLLLLALRRWVWPELLDAVRERERKLEQQLADAEKNRAEAAALLEEQKRVLAQARTEAQDTLTKAKAVAEKERETLLAKARQEYDDLLVRARKEIGVEQEKAILALRREAVDLSIAAASKLLQAKLDTDANRRLVIDYLSGLEKEGARGGA